MPKKIKALVMGGHTKGFHDFAVMGPICRQFFSKAGFDVTISKNRDDFKAEAIKPYNGIACYTTGENLPEEQRAGLMGAIIRFTTAHKASGQQSVHEHILRPEP